MIRIDRTISIGQLMEAYPESVGFLIKRNLPCLVCGEPTWGTLEELAREKQWSESAIDALVNDMNKLLVEKRAS